MTDQWSNTEPYDLAFYLWSYAGEPGSRHAYWEFMDKLLSIGVPYNLAKDALFAIVEHPSYFEIDEENGLFFIKRALEEPE